MKEENNGFYITFTFEWAINFFTTITRYGFFIFRGLKNFSVMAADNTRHVLHTRVTHFYIVPIVQLMIFMMWWKVLIQ